MTDINEQELIRIKDLLMHTSEFIAYFELADQKMLEWRVHIEEQSANMEQQRQSVIQQLNTLNTTLSATGISHLTEQLLLQGKEQLKALDHHSQIQIQQVQHHQKQLEGVTKKCAEKIEQYTLNALRDITSKLAQYDINQFHRIANESCTHVERIAQLSEKKNKNLTRNFHLRYGLLAVITTVITVFITVLYLSDELPWEMHHQAKNERNAGKVLLNAWPKLTQEEKAKILKDQPYKG
jgi:hypothetical protein